MKKLVVLLTLVATVSAFSQGQINFNNRVSAAAIDAPIAYDGSGPATAGKINVAGASVMVGNLDFGGKFARAALYGGPAGTAEGSLSILTPNVPFRSGSLAGYVDVTSAQGGATRTVAGVPGGSPAVFQIRAWDTGAALPNGNLTTYEEAVALIRAANEGYFGVSGLVNVAALGTAPNTPPNLVGLAGFSVSFVPEPSIIGLGLLGAVAGMVVFRRRR